MAADPSESETGPASPAAETVISVDAMGGDRGPATVVAGMVRSAYKNADIRFVVHGPREELYRLIRRRRQLADRCEIVHAEDVVSMREKPSHVVRHGKGTSMWSAIEAVREGRARVAVSCGNTGALMALSMLRLRRLPGVNRPAIACLWPSRNAGGFNIMLDVGADIRADAPDLCQYAMMGASYARNGMGIAHPRVGLLNVGTEEHKGRAELHHAHEMIAAIAAENRFDYVGFVEGGDIPSDGHGAAGGRSAARGLPSLAAVEVGRALRADIAAAAAEAYRPAPGQRRGVSRAQRHGHQEPWRGGCHRCLGRDQACVSVVAIRIYRPARGTGCVRHAAK